MTYRPDDREGIRKLFNEAIAASEEKNGAPDLDLVAIYFSALCDDYKNDLVSADAVIADYDRFTPAFEKAGEDAAALKEQFDAAFGAQRRRKLREPRGSLLEASGRDARR